MKRFWIWQRHATTTHQFGSIRITPFVQSIGLRWRNGGWLWQFPAAIEVVDAREDDEGEDTRQYMPIADPTRTVVWFLYALVFTLMIATALNLWLNRKRKLQGKKG